jgi:hypothetical protein
VHLGGIRCTNRDGLAGEGPIQASRCRSPDWAGGCRSTSGRVGTTGGGRFGSGARSNDSGRLGLQVPHAALDLVGAEGLGPQLRQASALLPLFTAGVRGEDRARAHPRRPHRPLPAPSPAPTRWWRPSGRPHAPSAREDVQSAQPHSSVLRSPRPATRWSGLPPGRRATGPALGDKVGPIPPEERRSAARSRSRTTRPGPAAKERPDVLRLGQGARIKEPAGGVGVEDHMGRSAQPGRHASAMAA